MQPMPRPRPPYLSSERTRHGKFIWYVRRPGRKKVRLRAEYGTPEFMEQYQAALAGETPSKPSAASSGTLEWLLALYRDSSAWAGLSSATRRQRENIFKHVMAKAGKEPAADIDRADIQAGIDARKATPAQARNFRDAMRGMFVWAVRAGLVPHDPTAATERPKKVKGPGFVAWTEDDVAAYERRWPIGTKERVWIDVLLYTGLRRGDAVRLGRQHVSDGVATIRTEKSQFQVEVTIPILPVLLQTLAAGPTGDLAFICGTTGKPLTKESFGTMFKSACKAAGLMKRSAHGCRKIGATRAANAGATIHELNAIFGWTGTQMASHYTQLADNKRLARGAMDKLMRAK
jgi:integrase